MHHHVLMQIQFCLLCQRKGEIILHACLGLNPNKKFIGKKLGQYMAYNTKDEG
jgi:hypothetical protein